jgi:phage/plasmid-like protein (TIGR03299 family)
MAHELEIAEDGTVSMAYTGELPWHGLGKRVPADLSPEQMLKAANLDWTVDRKPLFFSDEQGNKVLTSSTALVRSSDNKVLTVVSDKWNPVQNIEAFEFFNDFVNAGEMEMHTAGSLKGGKVVWALAKIKDSFELFGGDKVEGYLLFSNPHEFGRSIDIRFTPIRVVCNNTITVAINEQVEHFVKVNHRSKFDADAVKSTLGVAKERLNSYKEQAQFLGSKKFKQETITEYFNRVFPTLSRNDEYKTLIDKEPISRQAKAAFDVLQTQPGARFAEGSWWHAFNTVTFLTDHLLGRSKDTRLTSAWYGTNKIKKDKALDLALEYAETA